MKNASPNFTANNNSWVENYIRELLNHHKFPIFAQHTEDNDLDIDDNFVAVKNT